MKRKRFDRDIWNFGDSPYYQMRMDTEGFHGLICLLRLTSGNTNIDSGAYQYWDMPKAGKAAVCGKGMAWLQLVPDGAQHALTAMYLPNGALTVCYVDMIDKIEFDPDGVAVFWDKYLDVIFTPQGDVSISDRDELDEAFQTGDLTERQYEDALAECDRVLATYCADIPQTVIALSKLYDLANKRIDDGEPPFPARA